MNKNNDGYFPSYEEIKSASDNFAKATIGGYVKDDVQNYLNFLAGRMRIVYGLLMSHNIPILISGDSEEEDGFAKPVNQTEDKFLSQFINGGEENENYKEKYELLQSEIDTMKQYYAKSEEDFENKIAYLTEENENLRKNQGTVSLKENVQTPESNEELDSLKQEIAKKDAVIKMLEDKVDKNETMILDMEGKLNEKPYGASESSDAEELQNKIEVLVQENDRLSERLANLIDIENNSLANPIELANKDIDSEVERRYGERILEKEAVIKEYRQKIEEVNQKEESLAKQEEEYKAKKAEIDEMEKSLRQKLAQPVSSNNLSDTSESILRKEQEAAKLRQDAERLQRSMQDLLIMAETKAENLESESKARAEQIVKDANDRAEVIIRQSEEVLANTETERQKLISSAKEETNRIIGDAKAEAQTILSGAENERNSILDEIKRIKSTKKEMIYLLKQAMNKLEVVIFEEDVKKDDDGII